MIHDPIIEVTCDECRDVLMITPEYVYADYSGRNGRYDCSDAAIERQVERMGWMVVERDHHLCEACKEHEALEAER